MWHAVIESDLRDIGVSSLSHFVVCLIVEGRVPGEPDRSPEIVGRLNNRT